MEKVNLDTLKINMLSADQYKREKDAGNLDSNALYITDAMLEGSGLKLVLGTTAPTDTEDIWIDTSLGGVLKYYNGSSWVAIKSTWG